MDNKDEYVWEITGTTAIDDKYVEEELKREAKAFASGKGKNTGFCLRGLCGQDVSKIDMSNLSEEMFKRLTFDSKTKFSQEQIEKFHPFDIIMEQGKQFGNIGESEIDGSGTTIAIIDRFSDISVAQFEGRTITVYRVSKDGVDDEPVQPNKEGIYLEGASVEENGLENGFHGNTTDSLAVGKECGVGTNANVILFHVDGIGNQEAQEHVIKFIENREESNIPDIISISAKTKIDEETLKKLEKLGCAFINSDVFMKDFTWGRSDDDGNELVRDEFIQYTIDAFADRGIDINKLFNENTLIPVTGRTSSYIDDNGKEVYKYNGSFCGNSFAICQVAGLFLIARQINPDISYDDFIKTIKESQKENSESMMYVDPKDIIEKIKENREKSEPKGEQFDATLSPEEAVEVSDVTNEFESQLRADLTRNENALENAEEGNDEQENGTR